MLPPLRIEGVCLGVEKPRLDEAQLALPFARNFFHRDVAPRGVRELAMHLVRVNDLLPQHLPAAERRAQEPAPALRQGAEREARAIADEPKHVFAGRGCHDRPLHAWVPMSLRNNKLRNCFSTPVF